MFSQTLALNEKKDTTITFSLNQGKYLLKEHYRANECDTLRSVCEKQKSLKDSTIKELKANIVDYKATILNDQKIKANDNHVVYLKDNQIQGLKTELDTANKAIRWQKFYKWLAIGVGGAVSGYLGYKYVTK